MPAALYIKETFYVPSSGTREISNVNGFVVLYNYLSTPRLVLFWASYGEIIQLSPIISTGPISLSYKEDRTTLVVSNTDSANRPITIFYQNLKVD